jgi:hypothetical protein
MGMFSWIKRSFTPLYRELLIVTKKKLIFLNENLMTMLEKN